MSASTSIARQRIATISIKAPEAAPPADIDGLIAQGASFWPLQVARELDDAILHLRINELETAMLVFKSHGDRANVLACDAFLEANKAHWLVNEIRQYWKRVLKRIDVTSRTLVTLVEPGSCFVGTLAELVFAADRSYMLIGSRQGDNRAPPTIELSAMNFGPYPMSHGLTRLQSRFQADPSDLDRAEATIGTALDAEEAEELGLVTFALDDIDWDDEVRVFFEERTSLLARRPHRHGSQSALRRPRDHGIENLLAPDGVAELDLPAPQRGRRRRRAAPLRHRPEGAVRYDASLSPCPGRTAARKRASQNRDPCQQLLGSAAHTLRAAHASGTRHRARSTP